MSVRLIAAALWALSAQGAAAAPERAVAEPSGLQTSAPAIPALPAAAAAPTALEQARSLQQTLLSSFEAGASASAGSGLAELVESHPDDAPLHRYAARVLYQQLQFEPAFSEPLERIGRATRFDSARRIVAAAFFSLAARTEDVSEADHLIESAKALAPLSGTRLQRAIEGHLAKALDNEPGTPHRLDILFSQIAAKAKPPRIP